MKRFKFTFEEIFKNGASIRHSITIDLSIKKNWEAICNYDPDLELNEHDKIYTDNPEKWLEVMKNSDRTIFDSANVPFLEKANLMRGYSDDTFSDEIGDEPDESYYNNGPEKEIYYFEESFSEYPY